VRYLDHVSVAINLAKINYSPYGPEFSIIINTFKPPKTINKLLQFLQTIAKFFSDQQIPYMLSGSMAMSIYTLPRATRDFDFVVHLQRKDVDALVQFFEHGYYCSADAVKDAINRNSMFNIIDHASGYKADFIILKNEPYRQTEFNRKRTITFFGIPVYIVSPEDLLLSKLIWIQQIQSNLQLEDIKNLSEIETLDWEYINDWIKELKLNKFNLF